MNPRLSLALYVHDFLVPARPLEGSEGQAARGRVVEGHADAPEVNCGPVLLLVVLPQHGTLVHVWVLEDTHTHTQINTRDYIARFQEFSVKSLPVFDR